MTREEQRMKLWCDVYLSCKDSPLDRTGVLDVCNDAVQAFDKAFPPPEPDTRFDRLVQWIKDNDDCTFADKFVIDGKAFDRAVKDI